MSLVFTIEAQAILPQAKVASGQQRLPDDASHQVICADRASLEADITNVCVGSRPCKNVLSDGGAEVETKRSTPRAQARIASINGLVPITAITRFIL